jgi:hypothetical protein
MEYKMPTTFAKYQNFHVRIVLTASLNFKVREVLNLVRSFISLLQVCKVPEIFVKSILLLEFSF